MRHWLAAVAVAASSFGCAATSPMLVEPRLVREGDVRLQLGGAAAAPVGGDLAAIQAGRQQLDASETAPPDDPSTTQKLLPATVVGFGARPGVAPLVRTTLSLSKSIEASLLYGGRDARVGGRYLLWESRSVDAGAVTLSIGGDGHVLLRGRPEDGYINGVASENVRGYGVQAPLLLGWQSDAGLLIAYVGALVGYERVTGQIAFTGRAGTAPAKDVVIGRAHVTGTLGLGLGFRKVRVIVECGARRDFISARIGDESANVALISLTPAFAFGVSF